MTQAYTVHVFTHDIAIYHITKLGPMQNNRTCL